MRPKSQGIAAGTDFGALIHESLLPADAVLVAIEKHWLSAVDDPGHRRLYRADNWFVQEVGTALPKGVTVFPVLAEHAPFRPADELRTIARLFRINPEAPCSTRKPVPCST